MRNLTFNFLVAASSTVLLASSAHAAITYIDGDFAANTTLADGTAMNLVANEAAVSGGAGNPEDYYVTGGTVNTTGSASANWGERTRGSVNGPSVLVGPQGATGDAPTLRTQLTGLADGTYNVYAYFMSAGAAWQLEAGLTEGSLAIFTGGTTAPLAVAADFDVAPDLSDSAGIDLYQASLGTAVVSGGVLDVFIDDVATNQRAWYEGVGYEAVPEPGSAALIGLAGLGLIVRRRRK